MKKEKKLIIKVDKSNKHYKMEEIFRKCKKCSYSENKVNTMEEHNQCVIMIQENN